MAKAAEYPKTKAAVLTWAAAHEIEIDEGKHVHAHAPIGKRFAALGTHNIDVWDTGFAMRTPDWRKIGRTIERDLALEDCDASCECHECGDATP